tara:strand:- start:3389 stop:3856 length:468 start_codon:yes stop_codon:yes gene_type:complete
MKEIIFLILCFLSAPAIAEESGVKVDNDVERFMTVYCEYWSDGDYKKIISEIYDTPFTLYNQDNTKIMKTEAEVEKFLVETFKSLEEKNYGHSIINGWESYKIDRDIILIEMNFTRFLKDGKVMGEDERTASYIIRKKDKGFKILAVIPHTTVAE